MAALLESAGMSSDAQNTITIAVEPKMGFIKGTVGDDFVVPCIDFIITATTTAGQPQQVAAADCQRMVWQDGRWVIGEGDEGRSKRAAALRRRLSSGFARAAKRAFPELSPPEAVERLVFAVVRIPEAAVRAYLVRGVAIPASVEPLVEDALRGVVGA